MTKNQRKAIEFLLKYPEDWHGYTTDKQTVTIVCSLVNLGIAKVNKFDQMRLKSEIKARQLLSNT